MFQNLQVISRETDVHTRFTAGHVWQCAANQISVPATRDDVLNLAAEYVVVFSTDTPSYPVALLGLDGRNGYVTADGQWTSITIPARLKDFPFCSIVHDGEPLLVRAADAPHFKPQDGQPLYDDRGNGTDLLGKVTLAVARSHLGLQVAINLTAQLEAAGLLMEGTLSLTLPNGKVRLIDGYKLMNPTAFAMLSTVEIAKLEDSGAMAMLLAHQSSLVNLPRLAKLANAAKLPTARKKTSRSSVAPDSNGAAVEPTAKPKMATGAGTVRTPRISAPKVNAVEKTVIRKSARVAQLAVAPAKSRSATVVEKAK